jgi:hypothetical protein
VVLVRTDDVKKRTAHIIRMKRISELVAGNVVPTSLILFTLMMEATSTQGTSVLTRATRRHIAEDGILHSHLRENIKCYTALTG